MSKQNPKTTVSGKGRTYSDRHPYLKITFWADPKNWFWESDSYTESSKAHFRLKFARLLSDPHNQQRILNSQEL